MPIMQSTRPYQDFHICSFCLSINRRTTPVLESESLPNLTTLNISSDNTQLCWECKAHLKNYAEFCKRAERAQVLLNQVITQESLECNSLSRLVVSTTHLISIDSHSTEINDKSYLDYAESLHISESVKREMVPLKEESDVLADCETWIEFGDKCSEPEFYDNCGEPKIDIKVPLKEDNELFAKHADHSEDKNDFKCLNTHIRVKNKAQLCGNKTKNTHSIKKSVVARGSQNWEIDYDKSLYEKFIATENEMREYFKPLCFENKCKICLREFKTLDNYMKHMKKMHSDCVGEHKCDVCGFGQPTESALKQHRQQHYVVYRCLADGCRFVHKFPQSLYSHQFVHKTTRDKAGTYECHHCKKKFTSRSTIRIHMTRTHLGATKCTHCSKDFPDGKSLDQHVKLLHEDKMLICDICGLKYLSQRHLQTHRRRSHLNLTQKKYECATCNKSFADRFKERLHQFVHNDMPRIRCHVCKREFLSEKSRSQHLERRHGVFNHTEVTQPRRYRTKGGQPSKCDVCDKEFKFPSDLKIHFTRKHSDHRPYKCHICGDGFKTKIVLENHFKKHSDERPYKCTICSKSFKSSANLYSHKVLHSGEKPYTCKICSASFAVNYNLKSHMKIHTNERPFDCNVCGKKFLSNSNLKKHSRIHEGPL